MIYGIDAVDFKNVVLDVLSSCIFRTDDSENEEKNNLTSKPYKSNFKLGNIRVHEAIPYSEFFEQYMHKNHPCIFGKWATNNWQSCKLWTKCVDGRYEPDLADLRKEFDSAVVPVANCRQREYNAQIKTNLTFAEYLNYFEDFIKQGHPVSEPCLYLKDWHLFKSFPAYNAYQVPEYFTSDWLYELWEKNLPPFQDDFRFVYMGPKGSWTPFHADVYRSYSWSANICGRKKWLLYPPGNEKLLRNKHGHLPYDIQEYEGSQNTSIRPIVIIQEAGEIMFVPSGWHHQVHNLQDTISINHNWLNGCNILQVWHFLQSELNDVEKEISDCRDTMTNDEWVNQCQLIMKVNSGINYEEFFSILDNISKLRIARITNICEMKCDIDNKTICEDMEIVLIKCKDTLTKLLKAITPSIEQNNANVSDIFHVLSDICFMIPVLLEIGIYYEKIDLSSSVIKCSLVLQDICFCISCSTEYIVGKSHLIKCSDVS